MGASRKKEEKKREKIEEERIEEMAFFDEKEDEGGCPWTATSLGSLINRVFPDFSFVSATTLLLTATILFLSSYVAYSRI